MLKKHFEWTLSHTPDLSLPPTEKIPATVPGACGLDYAKAKGYGPYYFGMNFRDYKWMEDEYFIYSSELDFELSAGEYAYLCLDGVDYEFSVLVDKTEIFRKEGMFSPSRIDVGRFAGKKHSLDVIIFPVPKYDKARRKETRDEAAACCKSAAQYGWDWHPRLIPSGIWKDAYVEIHSAAPLTLDASYRLGDGLNSAKIDVEISTVGTGTLDFELKSPSGEVVFGKKIDFADSETLKFDFSVDSPALWYPVGYGEQPIYTMTAGCGEIATCRRPC